MEKLQPLDEQQKVVIDDIMISNKNVVILGSAGTGKSTIVKHLIRQCKRKSLNIGITATTGCAAVLIGGQTIHSYMGIGLGENSAENLVKVIQDKYKQKYINLMSIKKLLIDEISMMNAELFSKISEVFSIIRKDARPFGGVQVIAVGDFYQLPPVSGNFCFLSDVWKEMNFSIHYLKQVHRQKDVNFQELLERAKEGIITQEDIEILKKCKETVFTEDIIPTKLYSLNVDVDKINKDAYNKLTTEEKEYETRYKNKQSKYYGDKMKIPEKLKLRVGCQVMVTKNIDPQNNIINGTRGVVLSFTEKGILIKLMNQKHYIIEQTTVCDEYNPSIQVDYIPLQLAWAVTIHKSQGLTLDCAEIDLGSSIFQSGQAYTALSRIKDLNSVYIVKLKKSSFKVHSDVKEFYNKIKII